MQRAGTIVILAITAIVVPFYLWLGIAAFLPFPGYDAAIAISDGRIRSVVPNGVSDRSGIKAGDRVLGVPHDDAVAGLRIRAPKVGDSYRVLTAHGVETMRAHLVRQSGPLAFAALFTMLSALLLIAFAAVLCIRRPGVMSFAFWLYALTSIPASTVIPFLELLPTAVALVFWLPAYGMLGGGFAVPLIPFALRFPNGTLRSYERWAEALAWVCYAVLNVLAAYWVWRVLCGTTDQFAATWWSDDLVIVPLPIAAAILAWRHVRSDAFVRAQTAWALAGFGLSILAQAAAALLVVATRFQTIPNIAIANLSLVTLANVSPLLAIYPIVRHRLFDLGFVVNRATLYSILTLGAVATLAAVNWIAQHLITERLATLLQPFAAILIGLGYMRVRGWVSRALERTIFRDRFAAEVALEEAMKGFATAETPETIDAVLTTEATRVLSLQWASVVRDEVPSPATPLNDDAVVFELRSGDSFIAAVSYGPHLNGTEIDPEEMRLLRRLCDAAATAYRNAELQSEVLQLRGRIAALEARSARA